ncbi:MAG: YbjQ family protein [Candidatus Omnitrophica bacterium]|nr:YbjQ family protein [Candidatus Omnitrophota bacterium]
MVLTNIESVPGRKIVEHFGLVCGSTVRAKNAFKDMGAGFKNIVGGEMKSYTALMEESREEAIGRMMRQAEELGANAIINVRFSTSNIAHGAAELYVYGTAVKVE